MAKSKKQTAPAVSRKALMVLFSLGLLAVGYWVWCFIDRSNRLDNQLAVTSLAPMIVLAADALKADAPVEPTTGDIYFPQVRLYAPANTQFKHLTYDYEPDGINGPDLSISSRQIFNKNASKLYGATSVEKMFEHVPELQACQRGLLLKFDPPADPEGYTLVDFVEIGDGRILNIYRDSQCSELESLARALTTIKAY